MPKSPVEKAAPFSTLRRYDADTHSDNPLSLWERAGVRARLMPQSPVEKAAPFSTLRR